MHISMSWTGLAPSEQFVSDIEVGRLISKLSTEYPIIFKFFNVTHRRVGFASNLNRQHASKNSTKNSKIHMSKKGESYCDICSEK
jgi:hypothetical protein